MTRNDSSRLRPQLPTKDLLEPRNGADLAATATCKKVLDGGTVQVGLSGDCDDAATRQRLDEVLGDALRVDGLDRGVSVEFAVWPGTRDEVVDRPAPRHATDGTTPKDDQRGLCHTQMRSWQTDAGISRQSEPGKEPRVNVEIVMAHEVPDRVRVPSAFDRIRRGRATTLACRAIASEVSGGSGLIPLYRELVSDWRLAPRERAVQATAVTVAAQYLRQRPDGELWAVVSGALTDPAKVGFGDRVDSLAWRSDREWTVDVISVALRPGQLAVDLVGGRIGRSARALEAVLEAGGTAEVRLWTFQSCQFLCAASVRTVPTFTTTEAGATVLREVA